MTCRENSGRQCPEYSASLRSTAIHSYHALQLLCSTLTGVVVEGDVVSVRAPHVVWVWGEGQVGGSHRGVLGCRLSLAAQVDSRGSVQPRAVHVGGIAAGRRLQ